MTLEQMKNIDVQKVNPKDLVDISDIEINTELPKEERIRDFIRQVKNPYCFKVGSIVVKVSFAENGISLEDRLQSLLMKL